MNDIGDVGYTVSVSLSGLKEAESQLKALREQGKSLEKISGKIDLEVGTIDASKARTEIKKTAKEFGVTMNKEIERSLDFSFVDKLVSEGFNKADISGIIAPIKAHADETKKACQAVANDVSKTVSAIDSELRKLEKGQYKPGAALDAMNTSIETLRLNMSSMVKEATSQMQSYGSTLTQMQTKMADLVRNSLTSKAPLAPPVTNTTATADIGKQLENARDISAAFAAEQQKVKASVDATTDSMKKLGGVSADAISTIVQSTGQAGSAIQDKLAKPLQDVTAAADKSAEAASAAVDTFKEFTDSIDAAAFKEAIDSMDTANSRLISLEHTAAGLQGRFSRMFAGFGQVAAFEIKEIERSLAGMDINEGVFEKMFGVRATTKVGEITSALENIRAIKDELASSGTSEEGGDDARAVAQVELINRLREATNELSRVRERHTATLIADNNAMRDAAKADNFGIAPRDISASETIAASIERSKQSIIEVMTLMGRRADALRDIATLEQGVVNVAKSGGNVEAEQLNILLKKENMYGSILRTSESLLRTEKELSALPDTARLRGARKSLLQGSADAAQLSIMSAGTSSEAQAGLDALNRAGTALSAHNARDGFRQAVMEASNAIAAGLAPNVDKVISSIERYKALSASAFKGQNGDIELANHLLDSLTSKLNAVGNTRNAASRKEAAKMLDTIGTVAGSVGSATDNNGAAANLSVMASMAEKSADVLRQDELRLQATERMNADLAKQLLLLKSGVDMVADYAKMQQLYVQAIKEGIPIETAIARAVSDKKAVFTDTYNKYLSLNAAAKEHSGDLETQKMLYEAALIPLKQAAALQKAMGQSVQIGDKNVSAETLQGHLLDNASALGSIDKEAAAKGRLNVLESGYVELTKQRLKAEADIVDVLARNLEIVNAGTMGAKQYASYVDAIIAANASGVDTAEHQKQLEEARLQAIRRTLDELTRAGNISKQAAGDTFLQIKATEAEVKALTEMSQILGGRKAIIGSTTVDPDNIDKRLRDKQGALDVLRGKTKVEPVVPPPTTMSEIVGLDSTSAKSVELQAATRHKITDEIKKTHEELLSGINVLKNYERMQTLIVQASEQGVQIESRHMSVRLNKERIMNTLLGTARNVAASGIESGHSGLASVAYKSANEYLDAAKLIAGDNKNLVAKLSQLQPFVEQLRIAAGAGIKGSMAERVSASADVSSRMESVFGQGEAIVGASSFSSREAMVAAATKEQMRAQLPLLREQLKIQEEITRTQEFRETDAAAQRAHLAKMAALKEEVKLLEQAERLRGKLGTLRGKLGLDEQDTLGPNAKKNLVNAAKSTKQFGAFVEYNATSRELGVVDSQLASITQKSNRLGASTADYVKLLREAAKESTKVADNTQSKVKWAQAKQGNQAGQDMFDMPRMLWFAQLRMFWASFTNMQQITQQSIEFAHTLNIIQAVAQTTRQDIANINNEFDRMARVVPKAYAELAQATLQVAKAGFSADDALRIVESSAKLAQATGDSVAKVADVQTVVMHAWGTGADESEALADKLFNAVAKSRADIEGLSSALGYVAGIAPQANIPIEEVLAMMSVLSNAGLSMSKAGTYMRQFLNDLMNPSTKLLGVLDKLGISASEVDPRMNKLSNILKKLGSAGMNVTDAFEGMSLRAASAFSILLKQPELLDEFTQAIEKSGSVAEAFGIATDDFRSRADLFQNSLQQTANGMGTRLSPIMGGFLNIITSILNMINKLANDGGSNIRAWSGQFITNLLAVGTVVLGIIKVLRVLATSQAAVAALPFLGALPLSMGGIGLVITAVASLGMVIQSVFKEKYPSSIEEAIKANERLKESLDELRKAADLQQGIRMQVSDARSNIAHVQSLRDQMPTDLSTAGGKAAAGNIVEQIGAIMRGVNNKDVQEAGNELLETLKISPDMDTSVVMDKIQKLDEAIKNMVSTMQESLVGTLQKSMETATEIQKEALAQIPERIAKMQAYIDESLNRRATVTVARGVAPRTQASDKSEVTGTLRDKVKGMRDQAAWHDFGIDNVGDSASRLTRQRGEIQAYLESKGIDTKAFVAAGGAGTLDAKKKATAEALEAIIADIEAFNGALGEAGDAAVKNAQTVVSALETALKSPTGTAEGLERTKKALEDAAGLDALFTKLGVTEKSVTKLGEVYRNLRKVMSTADKDLSAQQALVDKNEKTTKTGVEPNKGEGKQNAAMSVLDKLVKDVDEYSISAKKASDIADLNELFPSPETYNGAIEALKELTSNLDILSYQYQAFKQNNPGKDLPVDQLKKYVEMADKAFASAYKLRTRSVAGETNVTSAIEAAKQTNGEDYQGVLRRSDVGKQIVETAKGLGGVNEEDTLDAIIFKTREMQTVITQFVREGAFKKFHSEAATALRKHRQSWREFRDDVRDSIDASTTALVAFQSVVEGLLNTRQFLTSLDANSVAMAGAADKTNKYRTELRKLAQEQKEVARVAGNAASYIREQGTDKFTIGSIMELNKFSSVASQKLDSMRSSLEGVTGEMITLTGQIVKMNSEISRSKLDFKKQVANLDAGNMLNENQMFVFRQQQLNETRDFARQSAKTASPEDAVGILTELRNQLLEYAGQYYDSPTGRSARNEAMGVQDDIIKLQEYMKSQLEAELAIRKQYQDTMMQATLDIRAILQTVSDKLATVYTKGAGVPVPPAIRAEDNPSPVRSTLNQKNFGPLTSEFDLGRRFESSGNMKAVGSDEKGGLSYGSVQFASKQGTVDKFLAFLGTAAVDIKQFMEETIRAASPRNADGTQKPYSNGMWREFGDATKPKDTPGGQAWGATVDKFGDRFEKLYMAYTKDAYVDKTRGTLSANGFDYERFSQTLKNVYASTSIQHGPAGGPRVFANAKAKVPNADVNSPEFINAVYAERARVMPSTAGRYAEENSLAQSYLAKEIAGIKEAVKSGASEGVAQVAGQLTLPTASPTDPGTSAVTTAVTELATASSVAAPSVEGLNAAVTGTGEGALATAEQLDAFKSNVGVADKATMELAKAHEKLTEDTNAAKDAILSEAGAKRQVTDIEEYIMPRESLKKYAQRTQNFNAFTQETFTGLVDSVQGGLTSSIVAALKTVGTEDSWYDAANEAIEAMTWKMVEIWVDWQTKLFMDGLMGSLAGTPNAFDPFNTSWGFGAGENAGGIEAQQDPTGMTQGATGLVTDVSATSDAATKLAESASADMANIVVDSANLAQESALLATEQTAQVTDSTNATTLGSAASGLSTAGTSLSTAASQLSSAASSMAASSSSSSAASGASGMLGSAGGVVSSSSSSAGMFGATLHNGGMVIPGYASGGKLESGNRQKDSALYAGQKGEFVIREPVVSKYGAAFFDRINSGDAQWAFDSLVSPSFDSGAVSTTVHKEASSSRKISESGQGGSRNGNRSLQILNLQDPNLVGQFMATPGGKRVVTNMVGNTLKKFKK